MFEIGQQITKENYTAAAIWCNQNGAHIEMLGGAYRIVANTPCVADEQARLVMLERASGLPRAVREMVLAENSGVSDYVRQKAREIENLAQGLRRGGGNV